MMPQRVLSKAEIEEIVNDEGNKVMAAKWPITKDKEILLDAVEKQAKLVEFSNGVIFKIRYSEGASWKESDGTHSTVFITPMNGENAPCGWFSAGGLRRDLLGPRTQ
ncbi:MAG TPA: hypothetical protein VEP90_01200 [Methylomirabilota bacterium]|nr:hypothetical protein [Methylomirabilota bacterium]